MAASPDSRLPWWSHVSTRHCWLSLDLLIRTPKNKPYIFVFLFFPAPLCCMKVRWGGSWSGANNNNYYNIYIYIPYRFPSGSGCLIIFSKPKDGCWSNGVLIFTGMGGKQPSNYQPEINYPSWCKKSVGIDLGSISICIDELEIHYPSTHSNR